jgi:hypothetical protein
MNYTLQAHTHTHTHTHTSKAGQNAIHKFGSTAALSQKRKFTVYSVSLCLQGVGGIFKRWSEEQVIPLDIYKIGIYLTGN